jgi:hypothetical protein
LLLCTLFLSGCEKEYSGLLIGNWIDRTVNNEEITMTHANHLRNAEYGFSFKEGGIFVERKNAGWCGTPPVTYEDFEGTWNQTDSLIVITVGYWGGQMEYRWIIQSINRRSFTFYLESETPLPDEE